MKAIFAMIVALAASTPGFAADRLIRLDDAATLFAPAVGKQVTAVFSDALVQKYFGHAEFPGVVLSELSDTHACFFGRNAGLDPESDKLKDLARGDQGDICLPRSDVSVKYAPMSVEGAPPQPFYQTDAGKCQWAWKTGNGIGLWAEDCTFDTGHWLVTPDAGGDVFSLSVDGGDPFAVLRQFRKKPDEAPDVLLPALRKQGLIPDDDECRFAVSDSQKPVGDWQFFEIMPNGKRKQAFDATPQGDVPEPPCGEVGFAVDYVGFFMVNSQHPDRVLFVNLGQDGTMFDPFSISLF
jgi:hypothetical protein